MPDRMIAIPPHIIDSINKVAEYTYDGEADFFQESKEQGETFDGDENMVFTHAERLLDWLAEIRP